MSSFIDESIMQFANEECQLNNNIIDSTEEKQFAIIIETAMRQLSSKQDYSAFLTIEGEEGYEKVDGDEPIDIVVAFDGHGRDLVIDIIRTLNLQEHFVKKEPAESIQMAIDEEILKRPTKHSDYNYYQSGEKFVDWSKKLVSHEIIKRSGSTISFAKIYRNNITKKMKIVAEWIGDSPILIFINGILVFESKPHNSFNESEIERLKEKSVLRCVKNSTSGFKLIDENKIQIDYGKYICYKDGSFLAMSRSLGHNRLTGVETEKHTIECTTEDEVKVLVFSDGVGDIINIDFDLDKLKELSAEEIVELSEKRWKKEWIVVNSNGREQKNTFGEDGFDDCCCSIWWQIKK